MKILLLTSFLFGCSLLLKSQHIYEYDAVDKKVLSIADADTHATSAIAAFIQTNFSTDKEKLRAVYTWVISNIRYDTDSMYYKKWGENTEEKMTAILRRRKAVCENFAALFSHIALQCGIRAIIVNGYTKQSGVVNWAGHSWCAVYTDNQWWLCDPTWDAGMKDNTNFFLVPPAKFIESHMPNDPLWQLLPYPVSHKSFRRGLIISTDEKTFFNYTDSVNAYLLSDSLHQFESASRRMKQAGLENDELKIWYAYNEMKVAVIYGDEDRQLYNSAVAAFNKATTLFNDFIQFRNNGFTPSRTAVEIDALFTGINTAIATANNYIAGIGKVVENSQYDTGELKHRLEILLAKSMEQKEYYKSFSANISAENIRPKKQNNF